MEGKSRLPEVTVVVPAPRPAASAGAVDAAKAGGKDKEPMSPGTPSSVVHRSRSKGRRAEDGVSLPGWKLDDLCHESCTSPGARAHFPYFCF